MYVSVRSSPAGSPGATTARPPRRRAVTRVVVLLGVTSLVTDISSEMVVAILPLFLTVQLGLSPLQFGLVDGLYQGATVLFRVTAGFAADRARRPKLVAVIGYGLSAVCKFALVPAASLSAVSAVITADRSGKGIRTAPRDALIAAASRPELLATSFGVHRALDTVGAMLGPLVAFGLLAAIPGGFDAVLVVSGCLAVVGVAVLVLFVPDLRPPPATDGARVSVRSVAAMAAAAPLRPVLVAAGLLGAVTVSDGFLYLALQRREGLAVELFPLLFVGTGLVYLLLAVPLGSVADRLGRRTMLVAGHVALLGAYLAALGGVPGLGGVAACLALLGVYYAATDGVLAAATAALLPETMRSSGLALVQTAVAGARFGSALVFGAAWAWFGREHALALFAVALAVVLPVAGRLLRPVAWRPDPGGG